MRWLKTTVLLLCILFAAGVRANESILDFHSDITVNTDGSILVTEHITVRAAGDRIKRGIYRDFPTRYRDRFGNDYNVGFDILAIEKDGVAETYHTERRANGIRIYIGSKNRVLSPGVVTYSIHYRSGRQLGYFDNHDELYWNVTGNDWEFTIEKASARVRLPAGISSTQITAEGYTGATGSKARDYSVTVNSHDDIYFQSEKILPSGHGLTIVVGWPPGFVDEPDLRQRLDYFKQDNPGVMAAAVSLLIILLYYLFAWWLLGRDPAPGVIVPLYEPPAGYSPAAMRFIHEMGYDKTCFAVAIINLAVRGYLTITDNDGKFELEKTGSNITDMAAGEHAVAGHLFDPGPSIALEQINHQKLKKAIDGQKAALQRDYEKKYFVTNKWFFLIGLGLTSLLLVYTLFAGADQAGPGDLFMLVWLTGWTFGVFAILKTAWKAWLQCRESPDNIVPALLISAFAVPFIGAELFVIQQMIRSTSYTVLLLVLVIIAVNWLFYELLKAPTLAGRKLLDKIEGFKNYLELAEKQDLDYRYPRGRTPELFERFLPFALALGVEQQWAEHFADVLNSIDGQGNAYSPNWYWHNKTHINMSNIGEFTRTIGSSLSYAIAASSTAPGSSSGSNGGGGSGGSSGGGGGGGGGGGW